MRSGRNVPFLLLVAVLLGEPLGAQPTSPQPAGLSAESVARARVDGETAAMNATGWFGRGVAVGFLAGPIGIAVGYAVAANSGVELPADKKLTIAKEPAEVQAVYEKSYADQVRKKRKSSINKGGWTGFAALVGLLVVSGSSGG